MYLVQYKGKIVECFDTEEQLKAYLRETSFSPKDMTITLANPEDESFADVSERYLYGA